VAVYTNSFWHGCGTTLAATCASASPILIAHLVLLTRASVVNGWQHGAAQACAPATWVLSGWSAKMVLSGPRRLPLLLILVMAKSEQVNWRCPCPYFQWK
jgi:hypothetical protein